ncbi:MAG: class I SAM-dependent methyltransferase [Myxococcales bacterium]|nr:class I SAM-dependent methyltransferase [Myxococcales bacterium]
MLSAADTAYAIATIRALEAELPADSRLFEDPYAAVFAEAGAHAAEGTQRFLALPNFRDAVRLRVRGIDDIVRDSIATGVRQLVLMGAGFDSRSLRLPEVEAHDVRVFEVDGAGLLERKRALLRAAGHRIPARIAHLPCDFTTDFESALSASLSEAGFRGHDDVLFVWEGVIPYIGVTAAARTLRFMRQLGEAGVRVVFDINDALLDPSTPEQFAKDAGFSGLSAVRFDDLWRRYLPGDPHPNSAVVSLATAFT